MLVSSVAAMAVKKKEKNDADFEMSIMNNFVLMLSHSFSYVIYQTD